MNITQKTYTQMNEYAKTIHPDAKPFLRENKWVIAVETNFSDVNILPESYKGTPAWNDYHNHNRSYEAAIEYFFGRYTEVPVTLAADAYNECAVKDKEISAIFQEETKTLGYVMDDDGIFPQEAYKDVEFKTLFVKMKADKEEAFHTILKKSPFYNQNHPRTLQQF